MIKRIAGLLLAFAGMLLPPTSVGAQPPEREYEGAATEISGACPSLLFSVDGTTVAIDPDTTFEGRACADIRPGTLIEVEGARQPDGRVAATEVEFESDDTERDDDSENDDDDDDRSR